MRAILCSLLLLASKGYMHKLYSCLDLISSAMEERDLPRLASCIYEYNRYVSRLEILMNLTVKTKRFRLSKYDETSLISKSREIKDTVDLINATLQQYRDLNLDIPEVKYFPVYTDFFKEQSCKSN